MKCNNVWKTSVDYSCGVSPSDPNLESESTRLSITCLIWRASNTRLTNPLALDAMPPNIMDGVVPRTCLSGSWDPSRMDGAIVPPSSDFARSIKDWDSPTVHSHANEPKQAGHTIPNRGQAWPSAHPVMGSTDLRHRP